MEEIHDDQPDITEEFQMETSSDDVKLQNLKVVRWRRNLYFCKMKKFRP